MAHKSRETFQLERLAFFSDAVFAIAITLLVIEIHVPHLDSNTDAALGQALLSLIPKFMGFFISFLVIGQFWMGHHRAFGYIQAADDVLIRRNMWFLLGVAFMPFMTALVSEYGNLRVGVIAYASWLLLLGLLSRYVIGYALHAEHLLIPGAERSQIEARYRTGWTPVIIALLAILFAFVHPFLALVPMVGSPFIMLAINRLGQRKATKAG
jgi:uncharacterized membrane protein